MWCVWTKHLELSLPGPQRDSMEEGGAGQEFTLPALHRSQRVFFEVMFKCHPIETDVDKFRTISLEGVGKMGTVMLYDFPFSFQQSPALATFCSPLPKCAIYRLFPVSWNAFLFISSNSEDHAVAVCTRGCALYKLLGGCKSAPRWSRRKTGGSLPLSSRSISASSSQPLTVLSLPWTSLYSSIKWCFFFFLNQSFWNLPGTAC